MAAVFFFGAVPLDNAQIGAAWATYEGAKRAWTAQGFGINFGLYSQLRLRAGHSSEFCGVLGRRTMRGCSSRFSQPHFGQYQWKSPDATRSNGYARHAEFYVRAAGNHPSVCSIP